MLSRLQQQAIRLLRTKWKVAQPLAEELFAILSQDMPLDTQQPITLTNGGNGVPLNFDGYGPDSVLLNIKRPGLPDVPVGLTPDGTLGEIGPPAKKAAASSAGTLAVQATVQSGKGTSYLLRLPAGNAVTATCVGIASTEQVPQGTAVIAFKLAAGYIFQVPVWLGN